MIMEPIFPDIYYFYTKVNGEILFLCYNCRDAIGAYSLIRDSNNYDIVISGALYNHFRQKKGMAGFLEWIKETPRKWIMDEEYPFNPNEVRIALYRQTDI